jgi:hypothetical protein
MDAEPERELDMQRGCAFQKRDGVKGQSSPIANPAVVSVGVALSWLIEGSLANAICQFRYLKDRPVLRSQLLWVKHGDAVESTLVGREGRERGTGADGLVSYRTLHTDDF